MLRALIGALFLGVLLGAPALAQTSDATASLPLAQAVSLAAPIVPVASQSIEELMALSEVVVPRPRTLTILHTNDSYGLFEPVRLDPYRARPTIAGGLSRAAALIGSERDRAGATLLMSAGNVLGPSALAASTKGRSVIEAMNRAGYDAWLPANHDFSFGLDSLMDRVRESSASAVVTNVRWAKSKEPLAKPYAVFEKGGVRVAVIGLLDGGLAQYVDLKDTPRIEVVPPLEAVARWVPFIRKEATPDLVVALTHLSLDQEMPLLTRDSGVDLVIGGFNSSNPNAIAVHEVVGIDGKRALHAGAFGTAVGKARLTFEPGPQGDYRLSRIEPDMLRLDEDRPHPLGGAIAGVVAAAKKDSSDAWARAHGGLARLADRTTSDEAKALIPEIMRLSARAEVAVLPRSFFHDERVYGPITTTKSLYYAMPWEDALTVAEVKGSVLVTLYDQAIAGARPHALAAGIAKVGDVLQVNGRPVEPKSTYSLAVPLPAIQGKSQGLETLGGIKARTLRTSVREAMVAYFAEEGRLGRPVARAGFPDHYLIPFWKSSLQLSTDLQRRAVDPAGTRYPDLTWKGDKSGMSWGGDLGYEVGTTWAANELDNTLKLSYHSDQLSDGKSQTSSDKIQFVSDYRTQAFSALTKPYATLTLNTRFVNDKDPRYFLGQLGTGLSHQFPLGLEVRAGIEYRHHFFDRTQPDRTGATSGILFKQTLWGVSLSTDLKLFATGNVAGDGLLVDDESVVSLPLTETTALSYKFNAYRNTLFPDWATRHVIGLVFKFNQPWLF
ncbi:MAG TPA: hypothetical protein V6D00_01720 [Pantanalinema sp.]